MTNVAFQPTVEVLPTSADVANRAATLIADVVTQKPNCVLGLATGSSPIGCYQELIRKHKDDGLDFANVTTFNLDEYIGLSAKHPQSYRVFMQENLFDHLNLATANTHVPDGLCADIDDHCRQYEKLIRDAGRVDLQLLGIGTNGHIAFNEPGASSDSRTRKIQLAADTIRSNSRFFSSDQDIPKTAITMGVETILEARKIVLIATGNSKADAVATAINGPVDTNCPASFLRLHAEVTFVIDTAAATNI